MPFVVCHVCEGSVLLALFYDKILIKCCEDLLTMQNKNIVKFVVHN